MSMMVSFVLSFFPRDVLDEILNLIESVSEDFPSYFCLFAISFPVFHRCIYLSDSIFQYFASQAGGSGSMVLAQPLSNVCFS